VCLVKLDRFTRFVRRARFRINAPLTFLLTTRMVEN
jgi:hypothetical protein